MSGPARTLHVYTQLDLQRFINLDKLSDRLTLRVSQLGVYNVIRIDRNYGHSDEHKI